MSSEPMIGTLSMREQVRSTYSKHYDPIFEDRMLWRAQSFRHITHVMPGQTILELGCGDGVFTRPPKPALNRGRVQRAARRAARHW